MAVQTKGDGRLRWVVVLTALGLLLTPSPLPLVG